MLYFRVIETDIVVTCNLYVMISWEMFLRVRAVTLLVGVYVIVCRCTRFKRRRLVFEVRGSYPSKLLYYLLQI